MQPSKTKLLVGCSGSVAAIKLHRLLELLDHTKLFQLKVVLTRASKHFLREDLSGIQTKWEVHIDEEEWNWQKRGDSVLHIELRKWADLLLIAPLSANTMAKIVNGICDNLLSLIVRCWNFNDLHGGMLKQPIVVCPAMNSLMYDNPITYRQLDSLKQMGVRVVDPIEKKLMCGEVGNGAMEQPEKIVEALVGIRSETAQG